MLRMLHYYALLPLIIGLTSAQPNSPFINYLPRRTLDQSIFDHSIFEPSEGGHSYLNARTSYQPSVIESRSSNNHNLSDDASSNLPAAVDVGDETGKLANQDKSNEPILQHHPMTNQQGNVHQSTYYTSNHKQQQPPLNSNLISKQQNDEQFNHYDLESPVYQLNHAAQQTGNQMHPRLHRHTIYSTTPVPILRLKNTKVDGKLAPTLIITLPKKRKTNGKSRRFPFLKAIVSSFISTDRRTSTPAPGNTAVADQQQASNKQTKNVVISKLDQNRKQSHSQSSTNNQPQLRSQSIVDNSNQIQAASSQNIANSQQNADHTGGSPTKDEANKLVSSEFEDNFHLPTKDELEDDEEEFGEWSEAPRPHNFDENQYYIEYHIESNKVKYAANGHEPIKQADNSGQAQYSISQPPQQSSNNQAINVKSNKPNTTFKHSTSNQNASPDFESMTSEVIDQEENDSSDKRPSISVRSRGSFLISVLSRMMKSTNFTMITEDMRLGSSSRASCLACHALAALYLSPFYSKDAMVNAARTICISFRLQPSRVCLGLIDSFKDDLDYIRTHTKLNRREMCGVIFGLKCSRITTNNLNWMIAIPNRPNMIERRMMKHNFNLEGSESGSMSSDEFTNYTAYHHSGRSGQASNAKNYNFVATSSNTLNAANLIDIVQITDIHVDPYYVPGSSAECGEPLCCRATSGPVKGPGKSAGIWGDYRNCDTPINTLRNTLKRISDSHPNAIYWMWTGDIANHAIWNITKSDVVYQLRLVSDLMKEYSKVPVFPVIGNHEGVPVNSFPPPEVKGDLSVSWLYDEVAKQWSYWLPPEAIKTLRFGGYYMVKIKPGFRIITLNTNYCTRLNPWTLYSPVDPGNQLQWLVKELHNAELAGDKVHILGHIPPDSRECTQAWLNNFLRIIDRFEHVVLAQYYGHTHRDELKVLYSPYERGLRPISVAYVGPSVTPFTENNPAYRIYSMNDKGYIQDHHTYYFNLTEANYGELGVPIWRHEYSAKQAYPLKNLGPEGWHNLISRFIEDDALFNKYHKFYFRYSQTRYNQHCVGKCRQALINDLIVAHPLKTKPRRLFGSRKNN